MARPNDFNDFEISKFAGLDLRGPVELQPEKTLSKCVNFEVGRLGELRKRPGIKSQHSGSTLAPSPQGVIILGSLQNSNVSHIIAQTDNGAAGVPAGKIYRSSDSGVTWVQISTPAATTYNCGKGVQYNGMFYIPCTVGQLQWDGTTFYGPFASGIPFSGNRGVVLQDRFFLIEGASRNIKFSDPGNFGSWPSTNSIGFSAEDRDYLVGIIAYRDRLVTLRTNSINVIYLNGPPSSWSVKQLPFGVGVPNEDCAVVYNDLLYLLSYDGIYRTDLTQMEEISKPIAPIFQKRRTSTFANLTKYQDCMAYYNGRVICSMITDLANTVCRMMVFNISNNTWTEWLPNIANADGYDYQLPRDMFSLFTGRRQGGYNKEGIYFSNSYNGSICLMDDQNPAYLDDVGFPQYCQVRTKATDVDLPSEQKRSARFSIRAYKGAGGTNLTGQYSVNGVDLPTFTIPIDSTIKQTRMKGPGYFRTLAFEVTDLSNQYIQIDDFVISIKRKSDISEVAT